MKRLYIILLFSVVILTSHAEAQCSMCTANAENGIQNGNTQTKGINKGVLYLLSFPFILVGGIGTLWYYKFRNSTQKSNDL